MVMIEEYNAIKLKEEKKRSERYKYRDAPSGWILVAPAILLLTTFAYIPLIMALVRSLQDYNTGAFNNLANFDYIFKTPDFLKSFSNVAFFTLISVTVMMLASFFFASLLRKLNVKLADAIKVLIYIPCLISGIIASIIFLFLINFRGGLINSLIHLAGGAPIAFTTQGYWPIVAILVPTFWLGFGYNTIVMYAALLNVPRTYYEAAEIDGAGFWTKTFRITIPSIRNIIILMLVNLITGSLQMMDVPYMITQGGPMNMTLTPSLYLFNSFRDSARPQNATIAGSLIVMSIIVTINLVAFRLIRSKKSEEL